MPLPLRNAGAVYRGFNEGRDEEHRRQRKSVLEGRSDEIYEHDRAARSRARRLDELEHRDEVETIEQQRGARDVARRLSELDAGTSTPAPSEQAEQLGGPGMEEDAAQATGRTAVPAPERPKALWVRTAEAQRDYWTKQGRPERAQKVMVDAYKNRFDEAEARHKYEIQPQNEKLRELKLTTEQIMADEKARGVMTGAIQNQLSAAGTLWGMVKMGATREALDRFNTSSMLQPGVKAESLKTQPARGPDGKIVQVMVLYDKAGEVVNDKNGKPLIYPVDLLERMHRLATTSSLKLNKGQSYHLLQQEPGGGVKATQVIGPDQTDPDAARGEGRQTDTAWSQAINRHTDDAKGYIESALGLVKDAMGNILKPENLPLFERAMPKVTAALNQARQQGLRLDQLNGVELGKRALQEARDEMRREGREADPRRTSEGRIGGVNKGGAAAIDSIVGGQ